MLPHALPIYERSLALPAPRGYTKLTVCLIHQIFLSSSVVSFHSPWPSSCSFFLASANFPREGNKSKTANTGCCVNCRNSGSREKRSLNASVGGRPRGSDH
jgi:hypothetical protein